MHWNNCAGVRRSTPSSEVVPTEQSRDLFQNNMAEHCLLVRKYLCRLIYSGVLQSAQFYLFKVAVLAYTEYFKFAKSSPPLVNGHVVYVYWVDTVYVQNDLPTEFSKRAIFS